MKRKIIKIDQALSALAEAKLASSGLTLADAAQCGITILSADEVQALTLKYPYPCLRFAYQDPNGLNIVEGKVPYYRLRFLQQPPPDLATEALTGKQAKQLRYIQPPNTSPYPYYAPNQTWPELLADATKTLVITEGELKAIKACKEGFPTIGLGGVYAWRAIRRGVDWLPLLSSEWVNWVQRKVVICFDSDYRSNPMVCLAIHDLAEQLERLGAHVHTITLPSLPDVEGKVGLDDFLTFGGEGANDAFYELVVDAEPLGLSKPLWQLNERYCYVRDPGLLVDRRSRLKATPAAFTGHLESTTEYWQAKLTSKGELVRAPVAAAGAWLKWPLRTSADRITYAPGQPEFINRELNTWPGWGCEPKQGDVKPFVELVDHLFQHTEPGAKEWFLRWLAYPLQFPGTKLFTSVVVHGTREGTGKSLIGYTLGKIYGKNFTSIGQVDLQNGFNSWAAEKQFVMGDDVTGTNRYQEADLLKKLITQEEIRINIKHIPEYTVPDSINYYFTTNRPDSFLLGDHDRRHFIHEVVVEALPREFYARYKTWLKQGGPSAVFHYLLNYQLGDWDPAAPAMRTEAKQRMTEDVRTTLGDWVAQLKEVPDTVTRVGEILVDKDLFTAKELIQFYDPEEKTRTSAMGLARELRSMSMPMAMHGQQIRAKDGTQNRYYVVRNHERWLKCKHAKEVVEYIATWQPTVKKRKF